jgi:hypothetical protein
VVGEDGGRDADWLRGEYLMSVAGDPPLRPNEWPRKPEPAQPPQQWVSRGSAASAPSRPAVPQSWPGRPTRTSPLPAARRARTGPPSRTPRPAALWLSLAVMLLGLLLLVAALVQSDRPVGPAPPAHTVVVRIDY